jgi:hypothetical protein
LRVIFKRATLIAHDAVLQNVSSPFENEKIFRRVLTNTLTRGAGAGRPATPLQKPGWPMSFIKESETRSAFNPKKNPLHAMVVSRSASHLASTLNPQKSHEALAEAVANVVREYGKQALPSFLACIEDWLTARGHIAVTDLVAFYASHGAFPELLAVPHSRAGKRRTSVRAEPGMKNSESCPVHSA